MLETIKKYKIFFLFFYLSLWSSLYSTGINRTFDIPLIVNRICTVLVYSPFIASILWKLVQDIRKMHFSFINIAYYLFAIYFAGVTVYRFATKQDPMDSIYFSLFLFGAISMYLHVSCGKAAVTKAEYVKNFTAIGIYMVAFRLLHCLIGVHFLVDAPINVNITTGIVALILPFLTNVLTDPETSRKQAVVLGLTIAGSIIVICTAGSRAIFMLTMVILAALFVRMCFSGKTALLRFLSVCLSAILVVTMLAVLDVGRVRYSLSRQTSISFLISEDDKESPPLSVEDLEIIEDQKDTTTIEAQTQINASDNMRRNLLNLGLDQVKKNPLFGTGDVLFPYVMSEDYIPTQSPHNFILETLICYGIIGTLLLIVLCFALALHTRALSKNIPVGWRSKLSMLLTVGFFFGFGLVQPIMYNQFMCSTFSILMSAFRLSLPEKK